MGGGDAGASRAPWEGAGASLPITEPALGALPGTVLHPADGTLANPVPQTRVDGNLYFNGTGDVIDTAAGTFTSVEAFSAAMAVAPVAPSGLEVAGHAGEAVVDAAGTPKLSHSQAVPVPVDAHLNQYLAAGTRHFGALWR